MNVSNPDKPLYCAVTLEKPLGMVWREAGWVDAKTDSILRWITSGEVYLDEITEADLPAEVRPYSENGVWMHFPRNSHYRGSKLEQN